MDFFYSPEAQYIMADESAPHIPVVSEDLFDVLNGDEEVNSEELERVWQQIRSTVRAEVFELRDEASRAYRPFNPDRHTLMFRNIEPGQRWDMEMACVDAMHGLLTLAKFRQLPTTDIAKSLLTSSPLGLQLRIQIEDFNLLRIYVRGSGKQIENMRSWRQLWLKRTRVEIPVYRRVMLFIQLKSQEQLLLQYLENEGGDRISAVKKLNREHPGLPATRADQHLHLKLFRDTPKDDVEMLLPNKGVRMKSADKLKLGLTGAGGIATGIFTLIKKVFLSAFHPFALLAAMVSIIGAIIKQFIKLAAQKTEYLKFLSQKLYFHHLSGNRGVIGQISEKAERELEKEALLAWYLMHREHDPVPPEAAAINAEMSRYMQQRFGANSCPDATHVLAILERQNLLPKGAEEVTV